MSDDVTTPDRPVLTTVPNVELCEVGTWQASTGEVTFTPEDFAAAIAAQDDPAIRDGVIKLGHGRQPGGLEQPTIGRVVNLRTTNDGMTLVGDLVGVPAWLAEVIPSAFPSRSIEGVFNLQTATGTRHRFVLEGVALLGVSLPAVETLEDIGRLYGVAAEANPNEGTGERVTISAVPRRVELSVSTEDVRRAWYDQAEGPRAWWWIRELNLDPTELIVDDDEGHLYRVPFTVSGTDVTFGEAAEVRIEYVAASESERPRRQAVTVFASRQESLPEGEPMDLSTLRTSLGLPDDATDEAILAAAAEAQTARTAAEARIAELEAAATAPAGDTPPAIPEGAVLIDAGRLADLEAKADEGARVAATVKGRDREAFIARVRAEGRLGPDSNPNSKSLREHLERTWDTNPEAAQVFASSLARIAATHEIGHEGGAEGSEANDPMWDDFERNLSPDVAATRAARQGRS